MHNTLLNNTDTQAQVQVQGMLLPSYNYSDSDSDWNNTGVFTSAKYSTHGLIATAISYLATVVNMFALYSLNRYSRKQLGPFSLALTNLCVADLLVSLLRACNSTLWLFSASVQPSSVACEIIRFSMQFGVNASAFIVALIGMDRALAVSRPMTARSAARSRIKVFLSLAWILSFASCLPMPLVFERDVDNERPVIRGIYICRKAIGDNPATELLYLCFIFAFFYLLPLAIMVVSYSVILCIIRKRVGNGLAETASTTATRSKVLRGKNAQSVTFPARVTIANSTDSFIKSTQHASFKRDNLQRAISMQEIGHEPVTFDYASEKTSTTTTKSNADQKSAPGKLQHKVFKRAVQTSVKTLFIIVITYIICWTPYYSAYLVATIRINIETPEVVEKNSKILINGFWMHLITYLNPLINPLIYGKFHKKYSRRFSVGFRGMMRHARRLRSV